MSRINAPIRFLSCLAVLATLALCAPASHAQRASSYVAAIEFVLVTSLLFELAEWAGAIHLAPDFADSYLGQQGDPWDAHKDMALAGAGAVLSMLLAVIAAPFKAARSTKPMDS